MPGKWQQAPAELTRRFTALLPAHPDVQPRRMFGYACAFVRGNFWTGLFEDKVVVRLPDGLHERFPRLAGAPPFDPMGGRPMKGWYVVPADVVADDGALARFMRDTFAAVLELPAKTTAKKKKTAKKKTTTKETAKKKTAKKETAKKRR
ncbi:MAG: TfoX/Sxy family protein [Deltaproteobacteria bacterium]|nr:TfoX/Sxy family protein [Deltaproteobacteria bacterium]